MPTRTSFRLSGLLLLAVCVGTAFSGTKVEESGEIDARRRTTTFGTLGVAEGETVRLSAVRSADPDQTAGLCNVDLNFFDTEANQQGDGLSANLAPGHAAFFDLSRSEIQQETPEQRAQIYAVVGVTSDAKKKDEQTCRVAMSIEIFDQSDGRTRIYQGAFTASTAFPTHCCCRCCTHDARGNCTQSICNCIASETTPVKCPDTSACPK